MLQWNPDPESRILCLITVQCTHVDHNNLLLQPKIIAEGTDKLLLELVTHSHFSVPMFKKS